MTFLEEIGEIHLFRGNHEEQLLKTLENKGFIVRWIEGSDDENKYLILVETQQNL